MVEFAVGDLYDAVAAKNDGAVINPAVFYECKYCPMFQISGASLRDADTGRAHAAAHRIAFEALLEPSPVLICPICDLPQKTSEIACVFGCMFNDLDLVEHLESEHDEILRDEMVCDFTDPRYLLTTFREKRKLTTIMSTSDGGRRAEMNSDSNEMDDDGNTITLSDGDVESNVSTSDNVEEKYSSHDRGGGPHEGEQTAVENEDCTNHETTRNDANNANVAAEEQGPMDIPESDPDHEISCGTTSFEKECNNNTDQPLVVDATGIGDDHVSEQSADVQIEPNGREQMEGVSFVACLVCGWTPHSFYDSRKLREEISQHVRSHIREESSKLPGRTDSSFADHRLLNCMDFSLEEYFEKEHLTDLSGTINSRIMERVYSELLTKLFGICVPVIYRILHGNNGNPFRPPNAARRRRKGEFPRSRGGRDRGIDSMLLRRTFRRTFSNSTETTESSDADSISTSEANDLPGIAASDSDQHIQCARAECGHSLLTTADRMGIVHHIAAHIRHDEARLLSRAAASPVLTCDCGMAIGSPMGYVYHIVHDHVFEHRQFSEISATVLSYLILIVETAIESVLAVRLDFRSTNWTLWCAFFCLEDDEGDEELFADSTDLNEHWLKLWENLIEESTTGKNMTLGDTIKLFEMHPFVDEQRLQIRKHKSVPMMDSDNLFRSFTKIWRRLNRWASDPVNRIHLACDSRWIRLAQIRRKVLLESRKGDHTQSDVLCRISVKRNSATPRSSRPSRSTKSPIVANDEGISVSTSSTELHAPNEQLSCASNPVDCGASTTQTEISNGMLLSLGGTSVRCQMCANVLVNVEDERGLKDHCALHAALEGRMLCALYIHRAADKPQTCPFCSLEMNVYKPSEFMEHVKTKHLDKARIVYDRYLNRFFPQSKIFSTPTSHSVNVCAVKPGQDDFIIRCQRSGSCGVNPVVVLPGEGAVQLADVDIAVVKHMLWHVRNDAFLSLDTAERELLTRALMIRLSSTQLRQILFMARRVTKQFYRYNEIDVVKYVQAKMDEIGCILFGVNKGLVFQMVFTRRFVRDQSGMLMYPPCVCRLCVDKELPRYSSERRKRTFVAYAHPVVLHILEHLNARQLPEKITSSADALKWKSACHLDGLRFKSVTAAIKHVLDAHNDLVELSALDMALEDMGLFQLFRDATSVVLGEQSWQLEEALGFDAYNTKPCPKPNFLMGETGDTAHRADCTRHWDMAIPSCTCGSSTVQESATTLTESTNHYKSYGRLRTTSLHDMPEASAACYEEFLHGGVETHDGVELPSPISTVTNVQACDDQAVDNQLLPSTSESNAPAAATTSLLSVKIEAVEEQSDIDSRMRNIGDGNDILAGTPNSNRQNEEVAENKRRKRSGSKKLNQKHMEIKREIDGITLPQRNKALPLKNVIQGSKTVAAALVAALGSPTKIANPPSARSSVLQIEEETRKAAVNNESGNSSERSYVPPSSSLIATNKSTRGENASNVAAVAVKKPRLTSDDEDTDTERNSDIQSRRRLRSLSGRRKTALTDNSSKT